MCFPPFNPNKSPGKIIDFISPIGDVDHVSAGEVVLWFDEIRLYTGDGPSRVHTAKNGGRYRLIIKNYNSPYWLERSSLLLEKFEFVFITLTSDDARTINITTGFATIADRHTAVIFSDGGVQLINDLEPGGEHMIAVGREDATCHQVMEHAHKLGLDNDPTYQMLKTCLEEDS